MIKTSLIKLLQCGAMAACVALLLGWAALPGYSQFSCNPSSSASSPVSVWNASGTSDWNVPGNWFPTGVPGTPTSTVRASVCILNGTPASPTTVDLGAYEIVDNLAVGDGNTLSISGSAQLTVAGSTIANSGTIAIAGTLAVTQSITLQNGGTVAMADGFLPVTGPDGAFFTNVDNTIQGWGNIAILSDTSETFVNDAGGAVEANVAGQSLALGPGAGSVTNNGTFGAAAGSTLVVNMTLNNFSSGTLTGGTWDANGTIQCCFPGTGGGEITTNNATIILDGANGGAAEIVDGGGKDALSALANNEGTLTIENGASQTLSANLTNSGTINVGSGSALTLTGDYSQAGLGSTNVNGTLDLEGAQAQLGLGSVLANSGTINVGSGSTLTLLGGYSQTGLGSTNVNGILFLEGGEAQLGSGSLTAGPQGEVFYFNGATVVGGFLQGSGKDYAGTGGASFVGTTIDNGPSFIAEGPTSFANLTNNGAIAVNSGDTLTWNGGSNADSGSLTVGDGATANVTSFTSSAVMIITGTGVVANSGTNLTLGGGSRTYIGSPGAPGGTLSTVAGTTIELNGGLLDNNGTVTGTLDVNYGSLVEGAGVYGAVNVNNGGAFHPGNSPGVATSSSATWGAGGAYQFDVDNATGIAGTNWSLWNITGNLDISAGTTPSSQFIIDINSLLANDSPGLLANFNPDDPYTWLIASAGSVNGFNAADFAFDTAGFANPLDGGTFSLTDGPTNIDLVFTPKAHTVTPEPSSLFLLGTGILGLAVLLRRQRVSQSA